MSFDIEDIFDAIIDSEHTDHLLHTVDSDNKTINITNHANAISKEHLEVQNRFPRNRNIYQNNNFRYERNKGGRGQQYNGQFQNRSGRFNNNNQFYNNNNQSMEKCEDCGLSNNDISRLLWKVHNPKDKICFLRGPTFNKHIPTRERILQREALDYGKQNIVNKINMTNDNDTDSLKTNCNKSEYSNKDTQSDDSLEDFHECEFDNNLYAGGIDLYSFSDYDNNVFSNSDEFQSHYA